LKPPITLSGRQWALLALLAMLMVATPVAQLWRHHSADLQALLEAGLALRPIQLALATQRALFAHRPLASAVLRGLHENESTRLLRQADVDAALAPLASVLAQRRHYRALDEAHAMQEAWLQLVRAIVRRGLTPAASESAHDLIAEQAMLIVDLEHMATGALGRVAPADAWRLALIEAPHLDMALARGDVQRARALAAAMRPRLQTLLDEAQPPPALSRALIAERLGLDEIARGERLTPSTTALGKRANEQLQQQLQPWLHARFDGQVQAAQRRRDLLALLAGAWCLTLVGVIGAVGMRSRRHAARAGLAPPAALPRPAMTAAQPGPGQSENVSPAHALIERARHGEAAAAAPQAAREAAKEPSKKGAEDHEPG
jgi:hypothetical protein